MLVPVPVPVPGPIQQLQTVQLRTAAAQSSSEPAVILPAAPKVTGNTVNLVNAKLEKSTVYGGAMIEYDIEESQQDGQDSGEGQLLRASSISTPVLTGRIVGVDKGNTITAKGVNKVKAIGGFDQLKLIVGKDNSDKGKAQPVLSTEEKIDLTDKKVVLADDEASKVDMTHQKVHLLKSDEGITFKNTKLERNSTFVKDSWVIDEDLAETATVDGNSAPLTLDNKNYQADRSPTENSKTLAESLLGTVAIVNQGTEFIADSALPAINEAVGTGKSVFGTINGGSSKYQTGSHIDVDAFSLVAGITGKVTPDTTLAGFVEAGWGSSTSHVSHAKGSGEHEYYGVGLAAKHQFSNPFYVDGAVRQQPMAV